ncbi:MAG: hypothetical protein FK733_08990 [Asgard group archaeon]|nr:hypothetical protein [Asgard group archaeon]
MTEKILEEIRKKYKRLASDELKYRIVTAINWYESLNLKNLARLVSRPETTTIRYIKQLLEDGLIDIDAEKTASSWGKYYKLSENLRKLYDEQFKAIEDREESIIMEFESLKRKGEDELSKFFTNKAIGRENMDELLVSAKQDISLSHNIQNLILNELGFAFESISKLVDEKGRDYVIKNLKIDPSDLEMYNVSLSISKISQLIRLVEFFNNTYKQLLKLKNEFKEEMDRENVPEDDRKLFYNYLFSGSIEFSYKLKDEE